MAMLFLEAVGPRGEELALAAADATGEPVGWDSELNSATVDSDLDQAELQARVVAELDRLDPDWRSHLRVET